MQATIILAHLASGVAVANAIPHLASGTTGRPFQSPFATPPGRGLSSPTVNVLWGILNLGVGYLLASRIGDFDLRNTVDVLAFTAGACPTALLCAWHFGRCNAGDASERP